MARVKNGVSRANFITDQLVLLRQPGDEPGRPPLSAAPSPWACPKVLMLFHFPFGCFKNCVARPMENRWYARGVGDAHLVLGVHSFTPLLIWGVASRTRRPRLRDSATTCLSYGDHAHSSCFASVWLLIIFAGVYRVGGSCSELGASPRSSRDLTQAAYHIVFHPPLAQRRRFRPPSSDRPNLCT